MHLICPQLTTDLLRVIDPDSSPEELLFSSMGNLNPEPGYLEHEGNPGRLVLVLENIPNKSCKMQYVAHFFISTVQEV